jgi:hypothetical protein
MANVVLIEDAQGELIDLEVYCSDDCAKTSPAYRGWFGCVSVEQDTECLRCGGVVRGESEFQED